MEVIVETISRYPPVSFTASSSPDLGERGTARRLAEHLQAHGLPQAELIGARRADGGFSSETWFIDVCTGGHTDTLVLRRQAIVGPLEPYDLAREVAVIEALQGTAVPVPRVIHFCSDSAVLGSPFVILERIEGEIPEYRSLPRYPRWSDPVQRTRMASDLLRALAAIHAVDWAADARLVALLPDLPGERTPPVVHRIARIRDLLRTMCGPLGVPPVLEETAAFLLDEAPPLPAADRVLVHGDFRVGNLIWHDEGIAAVLDWEGAGIGDPLEDLGYACHPIAREQAPELLMMLVPSPELARMHRELLGSEIDAPRLHFYVIYALYFHLYTFVSATIAALNGAPIRLALGYAKLERVTRSLIAHMRAYEVGDHAL
jgi:aminoglycoside phosphotransferase (APT) family kinase protein